MDRYVIDEETRNNVLNILLNSDVKGLPIGLTGSVLFSTIQMVGNLPKFEPVEDKETDE